MTTLASLDPELLCDLFAAWWSAQQNGWEAPPRQGLAVWQISELALWARIGRW